MKLIKSSVISSSTGKCLPPRSIKLLHDSNMYNNYFLTPYCLSLCTPLIYRVDRREPFLLGDDVVDKPCPRSTPLRHMTHVAVLIRAERHVHFTLFLDWLIGGHVHGQGLKNGMERIQNEWNEWCYRPWFCPVRLYGLMRWKFWVWIMPQVQDQSHNLLSSTLPLCY